MFKFNEFLNLKLGIGATKAKPEIHLLKKKFYRKNLKYL
jgi:hypothetical protein